MLLSVYHTDMNLYIQCQNEDRKYIGNANGNLKQGKHTARNRIRKVGFDGPPILMEIISSEKCDYGGARGSANI